MTRRLEKAGCYNAALLDRREASALGKIRVLDDHLINRIAAGEVVERPASVVKELVENALDAGARRVGIAVVSGGKHSIRIEDDGSGMDRDDALLALERHATSKLTSPGDLETVSTLGFRGEALPSIAAVSRLLVRTAAEDGEGTEIEVRGGRIAGVRALGRPRGTTVSASSLFFNVPARRKFLRSETTEFAHVARFTTRCALAHPEVAFRLEHGPRTVLEAPAGEDLPARLARVMGEDVAARLLPFALAGSGMTVRGWTGRPSEAATGRGAQHLFVNGRVVSDRVLLHAIADAYRNTMARDGHPPVVLFLTVPPDRLDVNVHPQKAEVRFTAPREVHDLVREALVLALPEARAVPAYGDLRRAPSLPPVAEPRLPAGGSSWIPAQPAASLPGEPPAPAVVAAAVEDPPEAPPAVRALAQFRESYIVAEDADGLVLVDQHAAHERILFERYLAQAEKNRVEIQRLLFARTVDLGVHERVLLEEEGDEFRRLGFLVEPFGGDTVRIDGVPAVAADLDPASLLRELLGEAAHVRAAAAGIGALRLRLVTTAACKAAIKIHHGLTREAMQRLLDDLFRTGSPTTCPHGRPLVFRLPLAEIERTFHRR
jgi:DNA mismatch repair protein MutL